MQGRDRLNVRWVRISSQHRAPCVLGERPDGLGRSPDWQMPCWTSLCKVG
jgi:hypothetical protein